MELKKQLLLAGIDLDTNGSESEVMEIIKNVLYNVSTAAGEGAQAASLASAYFGLQETELRRHLTEPQLERKKTRRMTNIKRLETKFAELKNEEATLEEQYAENGEAQANAKAEMEARAKEANATERGERKAQNLVK